MQPLIQGVLQRLWKLERWPVICWILYKNRCLESRPARVSVV